MLRLAPAAPQIVAVPSLQSGGMENVGLNTFDASHILACPATATDDDYQNVERESCLIGGRLVLWRLCVSPTGTYPAFTCCLRASLFSQTPPSQQPVHAIMCQLSFTATLPTLPPTCRHHRPRVLPPPDRQPSDRAGLVPGEGAAVGWLLRLAGCLVVHPDGKLHELQGRQRCHKQQAGMPWLCCSVAALLLLLLTHLACHRPVCCSSPSRRG